MEIQEPDKALQELQELDNFFKDMLGRIHIATSELDIHANILVAYQNSRLTKEVAKQSRRLTWVTVVLTVATVILAMPLIIQYVSWFLK
ncbi:MAG: hypothetical protein FJ358_00440 [Thaumarchaeota archaeon]|nr:hypothetical protein [Nitrososphaerota archaeon]